MISTIPFLLLIVCILIPTTNGAKYAKICQLQNSPLVNLQYDANSGQFTIIEDDNNINSTIQDNQSELFDNTANDNEGVRMLNTAIHIAKHIISAGNNFLRANRNNRLLDTTETDPSSPTTKKTFIGRQCPCDSEKRTYCLMDGIEGPAPDSCGVPWADNLSTIFLSQDSNTTDSDIYNRNEIGCFELNSQTVFIRNAWPVVVLWYGALFIFLIATSNGRYARAYLFNLCTNNRQIGRQVDRIIAREAEMRNRLRESALRARTLAEGPGRLLVRRSGVRMMRGASNLGREGTTREERHEATRWWLLQHLGIMSVDEEIPQEVEYVLRTKLFNSEKERARREELRLAKNMETIEDNDMEDNNNLTTPTKRPPVKGEEEKGPDTPETVATSFNGSDNDEQSPTADIPNNTCSDEDDDTFECTICLTEVEEGDRVGILSCQHIFHAECLQQWISRRNVCPLCQDPNIASPRPVENNSGSNRSLQTEESEVLGNQVVSEESDGSNSNSADMSSENSTDGTTPWYRQILFPIQNEQREAPGLSIIEMSESERVSSRRGRQQRRRRRHRQSDELW